MPEGHRRHRRSQDTVVDLGEEHRCPDSLRGEDVGIGVGHAHDQSVKSQASQVVGHLAHGVVRTEESGDQPANAFV